DYAAALQDGVIVPFHLRNIVFELDAATQAKYDNLTKAIARSIATNGPEAEETSALYLKRARILNLSINRIRLAVRLVIANPGQQTLVFHEDIDACNLIHEVLSREAGVRSGVYHSRMTSRERAAMLGLYRAGAIQVLVT